MRFERDLFYLWQKKKNLKKAHFAAVAIRDDFWLCAEFIKERIYMRLFFGESRPDSSFVIPLLLGCTL